MGSPRPSPLRRGWASPSHLGTRDRAPHICWAHAGMGASGSGRKREWAQVGVGASGRGRKWEWAEVGITRKRRYFALSTAAHADLERATVELRQMFLAATDHILQQAESSEVRQPKPTCTRTCTHARTRTHTRAHAGTEAVSTPREALVTPPQISRYEVCLPTSVQGMGSPLPHLCREWARPCHMFTGAGPTLSTSALGLRSLPPHLQEWAHPCHICAASGLTPPTSAPGLGATLPTSGPGLGSPLPASAPGLGALPCPPTSAPGLRPDDAVSGRFDFCLGETGLKARRVP